MSADKRMFLLEGTDTEQANQLIINSVSALARSLSQADINIEVSNWCAMCIAKTFKNTFMNSCLDQIPREQKAVIISFVLLMVASEKKERAAQATNSILNACSNWFSKHNLSKHIFTSPSYGLSVLRQYFHEKKIKDI